MPRKLLSLTILATASWVGLAAAAGPFDGVYKGVQIPVQNNNSGECDNMANNHAMIVIENGHFTRKWRVTLMVDVAPDGKIYASTVANQRPLRMAEIKGQITGNKLEADIGSAHPSLTRG
jgi:hypothetical protein